MVWLPLHVIFPEGLIKEAYQEGVKRNRPVDLDEEEEDIITLPLRKCGQSFLMGQKLDVLVQALPKEREEGKRCSLSENCDCS